MLFVAWQSQRMTTASRGTHAARVGGSNWRAPRLVSSKRRECATWAGSEFICWGLCTGLDPTVGFQGSHVLCWLRLISSSSSSSTPTRLPQPKQPGSVACEWDEVIAHLAGLLLQLAPIASCGSNMLLVKQQLVFSSHSGVGFGFL